jgi:hypothetical protein
VTAAQPIPTSHGVHADVTEKKHRVSPEYLRAKTSTVASVQAESPMHGTQQQNPSHTKANSRWGKATSRSPIKPRTFTRCWPVIGDPRPRIARHLHATGISQRETTRLGKTCEWLRFWNHASVSRGRALSFPPTNHLLPTCCLRLRSVGTGRDECVPPVPGYPGAQPSLLIDLFATPIAFRLIDSQL